jgi:hypothetical protein
VGSMSGVQWVVHMLGPVADRAPCIVLDQVKKCICSCQGHLNIRLWGQSPASPRPGKQCCLT